MFRFFFVRKFEKIVHIRQSVAEVRAGKKGGGEDEGTIKQANRKKKTRKKKGTTRQDGEKEQR